MSPMRRILLTTLVLILALGTTACGYEQNTDDVQGVPVDTVRARRTTLQETVEGIGSLEALERVGIKPEVSGKVAGIHFREGSEIRKGDLLFTLQDEKARHRLQARRAALNEARAQLENARQTYRRRKELYDQDLVSVEARDQARTSFEAARARVERLEAEVAGIREQLEDTRLSAPFTGVVGDRRVDTGEVVSAGTPLVTLVRTGNLKVSFTVSERYAGSLQPGQPVRVSVDAFPEDTFSGRVSFVSPEVRPASRDLLVQARVPNPENRLRPGNFASVEVVVDERPDAVVVPEEALVPMQEGFALFVVDPASMEADRRDVTIGLRQPGLVEITEGVRAEEIVVRRGHLDLSDGEVVHVLEDGSGNGDTAP